MQKKYILRVKTKEQKNVILEILHDDNTTMYFKCNTVTVCIGHIPISFDAMAQIVDYLREQNNK